ncbi:MAG TPA: exosortase/archaeosortase family protein [Candidatus Acidoferrales bacterium]|nr:exosortase/archaeosortase family protein [Candidatus Acidoferrales bacterium]
MGIAASVGTKSAKVESKIDPVYWIGAAAMIGLIAALYIAIMADLAVEWWTVDASSYGMLVVPITLYIIYLRRHLVLAAPAMPDARGLWLTSFACLILLGGKLSAEFFLARISLVVLLAGLVWTFWGFARFKTLTFPFILLGTMVPLPGIVYNTMAAPLQLFASGVATSLAQSLGVSIYRDGNIIHLATVSLGVAEACSGLNSLSALVVASLLLGFLENATILGRVLLFLISVPLAIAVNVLRVTGTAVLADYHLEFAMGFYHMLSGWLVFVLGFGLLWLIGKVIVRYTRTAR